MIVAKTVGKVLAAVWALFCLWLLGFNIWGIGAGLFLDVDLIGTVIYFALIIWGLFTGIYLTVRRLKPRG